jgi:hypothetical protein
MLRSNENIDQSEYQTKIRLGYNNGNLPETEQQRYAPIVYNNNNNEVPGGSIGGFYGETDNKSIASTPSKISKFTYSGNF